MKLGTRCSPTPPHRAQHTRTQTTGDSPGTGCISQQDTGAYRGVLRGEKMGKKTLKTTGLV